MILTNKYKRISSLQAIGKINKTFKDNGCEMLTNEQLCTLREAWADRGAYGDLGMPFMWYSWEKVCPQSSLLLRLSFPFWCLYYLVCLIIVAPFNWVVYGSVYGKSGKPCRTLRILNDWYVRVFGK